jgi:L-arabinose isomerase
MNELKKFQKAKAGLLLIASPRFRNMGAELEEGSYDSRKRSVVEAIESSLSQTIDLVNPGIVYEREDLSKAMDMFSSAKVDFVIAEFLSWAEDFAWVRFLRDMPDMPVIFVNSVKERMTFEKTVEENDFVEFLCNGTLVGSLEASGSIARLGKKNLKIVMGNRDEVTEEIISFSKAAKVRSVLRESTFGLLASYNELMWSTYMDPYNMFTKIGPEIRFISYSTLQDEIDSLSEPECKEYLDELKSKYQVTDDVEDDKFMASVRASLATARLAEKMGIDAMIYNDVDPAMFQQIGLRPGFYHPSFGKNLSVMVPEADMGAGTMTFILKLISGKHVNFIEPFHIESADNTFAAGHAGPNDHTDPGHVGNVKIARDVRFAKTKYKYAGAPFAWYRIPAGRKTMAQFIEENGKYKVVCTLVDAIDGEHVFASYSHGIFKPMMPVKDLFEKILKIGTTQHFALVDGDYRRELADLSQIMNFEYFEIN